MTWEAKLGVIPKISQKERGLTAKIMKEKSLPDWMKIVQLIYYCFQRWINFLSEHKLISTMIVHDTSNWLRVTLIDVQWQHQQQNAGYFEFCLID